MAVSAPYCGQAVGERRSRTTRPRLRLLKLDYTIQGDNLQFARVRLKAGQEVYAEAGKMVYKTPSIEWETRMMGETLGDKIWGAVKRKLMGESLFLTYFRALRRRRSRIRRQLSGQDPGLRTGRRPDRHRPARQLSVRPADRAT